MIYFSIVSVVKKNIYVMYVTPRSLNEGMETS